MHTAKQFVHGRIGPGFDVNAPAASILSDRGLAPRPGITRAQAIALVTAPGAPIRPFVTPEQVAAVQRAKPAQFGVNRSVSTVVSKFKPGEEVPFFVIRAAAAPKQTPRAPGQLRPPVIAVDPLTPILKAAPMTIAPPNEKRGIIHKRIGGGIKKLGQTLFGGGDPFAPFFEPVPQSGACGRGQVSIAGRCIGLPSIPKPSLPIGTQSPTGSTRGENLGVFPFAPPQAAPVARGGVSVGGPLVPGAVTPLVEAVPRSFCPTGYVIGMDGMCYHKKLIPNKFRRWPKPTAPLLTGGDVNILRKAQSLEKRIKSAAKRYLAPPPKRPR